MKISRQILLLLIVFHHTLVAAENNVSTPPSTPTEKLELVPQTEQIDQIDQSSPQKALSITETIVQFLDEMRADHAEKGYRSDYEIGNIAPHLSKQSCLSPILLELNRAPISQNQLTLSLQCKDQASWRFYVSIEFNLYADIVKTQHNIRRGQIIQAEDIRLSETLINRTHYSHYTKIAEVIGMVAKRSIRAESGIQPGHLSPPMLIKRGDDVIILASNSAISVKMNGTALSDGTLGQQISVKNSQSKRVVKAMVSERGLVKIVL